MRLYRVRCDRCGHDMGEVHQYYTVGTNIPNGANSDYYHADLCDECGLEMFAALKAYGVKMVAS
jgi:hypothetical protein